MAKIYSNVNFFKPSSSPEPTTSITVTLNFESNSMNAEIFWCLNMVNQHLCYNLCSHVFFCNVLTVKLHKKFQWSKPKVDIWLSMAWSPTSKINLWRKSTFPYFVMYHLMKVLILSPKNDKWILMFVIGTQRRILLLHATLIHDL